MVKNLLLILVANSMKLISVSASITLSKDFFEEMPESCLMDFHHEPASSNSSLFFQKIKGTSKTIIQSINFIS